ncbi:putative peptidylprolyl isomerase [Helianthus annuus]|nr:putative peptidylprolyl isomerase [Helianthus annuus]
MGCVDCWTVHYEGSLAEIDEVFDTTHEDNTIFTFELGKGPVIKAWDVALRTMKVGEVAKITCKSDYANEKESEGTIWRLKLSWCRETVPARHIYILYKTVMSDNLEGTTVNEMVSSNPSQPFKYS